MSRYVITPTLINSFNYIWNLKCGENNEEELVKKAYNDFVALLNKQDIPINDNIKAGLEFEKRCYNGELAPDTEKIINILQHGAYQVRAERNVIVDRITFKLVGIADYIKGSTIYDIKKSITGTYSQLKYLHSAQHSAYFKLFPSTLRFIYLYNDRNGETFTEQYLRVDTPPIENYIRDFMNGVKSLGLWDTYIKNWEVKE